MRIALFVGFMVFAFAASAHLARGGRIRRRAGAFLRRMAWLGIVALAVFTVSFFLMRAVPGGPFDTERGLEPEIRRALEARYRLDRPLLWQYADSLERLLALDLGPSMKLKDYSVAEVIVEGLPSSLALGLGACLWMIVLGIPLGVLAAVRRDSTLDRLGMGIAALGMALPNFVLAGLLMIPLVFLWRILPPAGLSSPRHLLLPAFCLGAPFAAQVARLARTGMLDVLGREWIRTARAKGLPEWRVVLGHALRGGLMPVIAWLGPALAGILTGSLVIEEIFAVPGVGTHFVQSAINRDYTLAMGMVLLYTVFLFVLNALADLLQQSLDPTLDS